MSDSNSIVDNLINTNNTTANTESSGGNPTQDTHNEHSETGQVNTNTGIISPNDVSAHIANKTDPIAILFGPSGCGKTMLLLRLARYLNNLGYEVNPRRDFRPVYDTNYTELCDKWEEYKESDLAAIPTSYTNFMLLSVSKRGAHNGRSVCQILEAPGELYFSKKESVNAPFPHYLESIKSSKNRKIWCIMLEPDWESPAVREKYVRRIGLLKRYITPKDTVILIYNKVDLTDLVFMGSQVGIGALVRRVNMEEYPGLLDYFKNEHPITRFWRKYDCNMIAFSTGSYSPNSTGGLLFTPGMDDFPKKLWSEFCKKIRG